MSHKKSGRKHPKGLGDFTLNDFANSAVCKNRTKKSENNVIQAIKKLEIEKTWDENDDDAFEGEFVEEVNEDGTTSFVIRKVEPRRRKKTLSSSDNLKENQGVDYPIDIWFLISEYIRPEEVGIFGAICKTSLEVVSTAKFWFSLYRRYYKSVPHLPEQLQPESLVRKYKLRFNVIRALHYTYPPFVKRIKAITTFEQHPDVLKRRQCILMWFQKEKTQWVYYFKMKEKAVAHVQYSSQSAISQPDLLEILDDVLANEDENCRILQVTCRYFTPVTPVLGHTLTSVSLTLSQGFRHHRLQLAFSSGVQFHPSTRDGSNCVNIILDPVINVKVLDWWHPLYPYNHKMEHLLNQE